MVERIASLIIFILTLTCPPDARAGFCQSWFARLTGSKGIKVEAEPTKVVARSAAPAERRSLDVSSLPPISNEVLTRWNAIPRDPPPDGLPYFVLGFTHDGLGELLERNTRNISERLNHPAVHFNNWMMHGDGDLKKKMKAIFDSDDGNTTSEVIRASIPLMVKATPHSKSIIFHLAGFNPDHYAAFLKSPNQIGNFTNKELQLILGDKKLFDHVRWWKGGVIMGRELTLEEVRALFYRFNPELFE